MRRITAVTTATAAVMALAFAPAITAPATDGLTRDLATTPGDPTGLLASDNIDIVTTVPIPGIIGAVEDGKGNLFVTGATGLTVLDITDPLAPVQIGDLPLPHFENEDVEIGGDLLLISNDSAESYGLLYVIDISDPTNPTLRSLYDTGSDIVTGSLLGSTPGHTVSCINECSYAWMTDTNGYRVIDLTDPDAPVAIGHQPTPAARGLVGIVHDVQVDAQNIAWTVGFGGTAAHQIPDDYAGEVLEPLVSTGDNAHSRYAESFGTDDGSGYNDYIHHNSLRIGNSDVVYVTEEDYNRPGCRGAGSFQRWALPMETDEVTGEQVITGADMTPIDLWVTEMLADTASPAALCSAHYFDEQDGLIAQGWYEQGLRLLDVTGDEIRQVGFWVPPTAMTWDAHFPSTDDTGSVVYAMDATHGLDVLTIDLPEGGAAEAATVVAPVRDIWRTGLPGGAPIGAYGYACRL